MDSHNFTQLISGLVLDNAQQQRTSTITIGSFDIAISIIMLGSILWDTYSTEDDSSDADSCASPKWFRLVHPAEVFPFVVSVVTLFQGGVFVGVQSSALQSYIETQCRMTAEVLWPTIWLFPLTVSVFGLETSFRSLGKDRFRARGRWSTLICVGAIAILTFALWLYSYLVATGDECVGALIIYSADYATVAIALASALILFHLLIGSVVTFQLLRTVTMDNIERIMATRVVCTQYISVLILACVLPYYIQAIGHDRSSSQISQMADIVVNLAGILNALLHLFLRTNSYRIAIRSAKVPWSEKRALRLFGPNDLNLGKVISSPLLLDPRDDPSMGANRYGTQKQDVDEENGRYAEPPSLNTFEHELTKAALTDFFKNELTQAATINIFERPQKFTQDFQLAVTT
ncbi:hypothetical protein MMC13_001588 [Lambiella insularis]|nr:hypothetical protein [Lambiella insularis]